MPLTPADVHNVAFKKPSIGKRGYDEDEVDAFLDVVEAELTRLIEENERLSSGAPAPAAAPAAGLPTAAVTTDSGEPDHVQASRLLGLAQETADRLTSEARAEAEQTLSQARAEAEQLLSDAREQAETSDTETRARAQALADEAQAKYDSVMEDLATKRADLEQTIAELRTYEREYRSRLKAWITEQLQQLDATGSREQATVAVSD